MIEGITIKNLRAIKDLKIEDFRQFNIFVGENNSGKSTILDALFLFTNPSNPLLLAKINELRGITLNPENWYLIFNNLDKNSQIKLSASLEHEEIRYLKITPKKNVFLKTNKNKNSFIISSFPGTSEDSDEFIYDLSYSFTSKDKSGELLSNITMVESLNGPIFDQKIPESIPPYLAKLKGVYLNPKNVSTSVGVRFGKIMIKKGQKRILKVMKKLDPKLEDLVLGPQDTIYCDVSLNQLIPLNVMGDGFIKILAIIVAFAEVEDGIMFIDEIENGLYHTSQEILWKAIFESAKEYNVQIFATTHSIECLDALILSSKKINKPKKDDIRLYRVERDLDKINTVMYTPELLFTSLEKGWEVR